MSSKNWLLSKKKQHFWPKNGLFWAIRARKQPARQPNEYLPENQRYPKLPPVMGKLWSHWVESVWAHKKMGLYGCSVKNPIYGQKWVPTYYIMVKSLKQSRLIAQTSYLRMLKPVKMFWKSCDKNVKMVRRNPELTHCAWLRARPECLFAVWQ